MGLGGYWIYLLSLVFVKNCVKFVGDFGILLCVAELGSNVSLDEAPYVKGQHIANEVGETLIN